MRTLLKDDGSPIRIGDGGHLTHRSAIRRFLAAKDEPFISISHQCLREMFGGLGIRNASCKAKSVGTASGTRYALIRPWTLILNGEVTLSSADNKTIRISHFGDYDLVGGDKMITLLIGSKNLTSAALFTPATGLITIENVSNGLTLDFDCPRKK